MMSSHLALPRVGHLEELFHIFVYLKKYATSEMIFDPNLPEVDMSDFPEGNWNYYMYSGEQEDLPHVG